MMAPARGPTFRLKTLLAAVALAAIFTAMGVRWMKRERIVVPPSILFVEVKNPLLGRPISSEKLVRPDGTITLGHYGDVYVAGLTPTEIAAKVATHLRKSLKDVASGPVSSEDTDGVIVEVLYRRPVAPPAPIDLAPFWLSLRVASVATLLIVLLGVPLAYLLARSRFPGKGLVSGVMVLPLVLPPTVLGFALLQLLGRRAPLGMWLEATFGVTLVFHWSGAVVASAVAAFPLFLIPARSAFEGVDPGLEDVARLLGRREAAVFLRVTLPLAWRGIASGAVLAFARALGDFGATLMVAGDLPGRTRTASLAIYNAVQADDFRTASWLALLVAGASVAALLAAQKAAPPARGASR